MEIIMINNTFTDISDEHGSITLKQNNPPKSICCYNKEIIKIHDRMIPYPHDTVAIKPSDIIHQHNQSLIDLQTLMPPIIFNLRNDADPHHPTTRKLLSQLELDYFKQNGNNAIIFIHGFNVKYGRFSHQIEKLTVITDSIEEDGIQQLVPQVVPITSSSDRTLYRDTMMVQKHFGEIERYNHSLNSNLIRDQWLNGSEAHNWFVHMEDNLNRATQQFDRSNYHYFTRTINIAWSGDIWPIRYLATEEPAAQAGKDLVPLILQLHQHNIEINIIAHSLGARVLLSLMHQLGKRRLYNCLHQTILWQAAVPDNALSDKPNDDHSVKHNWHYYLAYTASRKITVLYSKHDWVLWIAYAIAHKIGIAPTFNLNKWKMFYKYLKSREECELEALLDQDEHLFDSNFALQLLDSGNDAGQSVIQIEALRKMGC